MKKIFLVLNSTIYYKNEIFNLSSPFNRDNAWEPYYLLKQEFNNKNVNLQTFDYLNSNDSDNILIYVDFPIPDNLIFVNSNLKYLIICESEVISPSNWKLANHRYFEKIFTWNDELVDNKKYYKLNFTQKIQKEINKCLSKKSKLCTLIAGNKRVNHSLELYSKRVEAIQWFEKNHPDDFEFYGIGWDSYTHPNKYIRYLCNKTGISKRFAPKFYTYKGKVESKKEVLEKYKFAICYENARDIPGYITEKIFDCFFAGCVPIYWGANNITEHIPKECFVDKREFDTYEKLYQYMKNMSDEEYMRYLDNIENFLNSEKVYPFSSECFAKTLVGSILEYKIQ